MSRGPRYKPDRTDYLIDTPSGKPGLRKKAAKKQRPHYSRQPRISWDEMRDLVNSMEDIFKPHFREAVGEKEWGYLSDGLRYYKKYGKPFTVKQANLFSETTRLSRGVIRRRFPKADISTIKLKPEYVDTKAITQEDLDALD